MFLCGAETKSTCHTNEKKNFLSRKISLRKFLIQWKETNFINISSNLLTKKSTQNKEICSATALKQCVSPQCYMRIAHCCLSYLVIVIVWEGEVTVKFLELWEPIKKKLHGAELQTKISIIQFYNSQYSFPYTKLLFFFTVIHY